MHLVDISELWQGLLVGGPLVARKTTTFDILVERGCTTEFSASWIHAASSATQGLADEGASAALWRRIRPAAAHDPERGGHPRGRRRSTLVSLAGGKAGRAVAAKYGSGAEDRTIVGLCATVRSGRLSTRDSACCI